MSIVDNMHFAVFMGASMAAFLGIVKLVLRKRPVQPGTVHCAWVSMVVVVGGMLFAKISANAGLSPAIYCGIPAIVTIFLPPVVLRMRRGEFALYVLAASVISPAIHVLFSLFLGWKEYLPFWNVPSLRELLS